MTATAAPTRPGHATWPAIGTTATVLSADPDLIAPAAAALREELDAIDRAASRFRTDSDLSRVNASAGRPVAVGPLMLDAVDAALDAAHLTAGAVDPTVGSALILIGYDRDFAQMLASPDTAAPITGRRTRGAAAVHVDRRAGTVCVDRGVSLDLGATAKALAADRAAVAAHRRTGTGVLVNLGGDIATAGPPPDGGWLVRVTDDHAAPADAPGQTICLMSGGLATSSTTVRRWRHGGRVMHHVIDPAVGEPVATRWRTVSVAADSCLRANVATTAALVMDGAAPDWLTGPGLAARLVGVDGRVIPLGGWPEDRGHR